MFTDLAQTTKSTSTTTTCKVIWNLKHH